uniref:Uncharacterized protein n=1 Tax=Anguilla anguilla TaxID=7936 RepID=A0A0E9U125_ANGAN
MMLVTKSRGFPGVLAKFQT